MAQVNATKKSEPKKKLIVVKSREGSSGGYGFSSFNFAFVSSPQNGRKQCTATMTCREYVNRTMWSAFNNENTSHYTPGVDAPIDTERLRLLVVYDPSDSTYDSFKQKLFNGKAALNVLERINNWKPSTITTVNHQAYKNAWLLTGPKEWLGQPQLLSLATFIMRLSKKAGPLDVDSFDALEACLYRKQDPKTGDSDTATYLVKFWDKIYILLKYHDQIFKGVDQKAAWRTKNGGNFGVSSGLLTFAEKQANYSEEVIECQKRFHRLCTQFLPRKNKLLVRR